MNTIKNDCEHCAYCAKHYVNLHGTFQLVYGCMHCINAHMSLRESDKCINNRVVCNHFEPEQLQVEQRHKDIENKLCYIADELHDIAQILKLENKK